MHIRRSAPVPRCFKFGLRQVNERIDILIVIRTGKGSNRDGGNTGIAGQWKCFVRLNLHALTGHSFIS
ncbi:hypothetical protein CEXT_122931 [Caerostris extrusa]|uniref:Uncharacterized protein n=1 Tax=Caerostris extrusa TaxID=172846 RepID=A0AAV4VI22_CAEEX|nr:hypothetical protein CEXT_122931 [Caerostris extrusa]